MSTGGIGTHFTVLLVGLTNGYVRHATRDFLRQIELLILILINTNILRMSFSKV